MSDVQDQVQSPQVDADSADRCSTDLRSVARRRALLKGVGKAGALAGAALPLRSLAGGDKPKMRLSKGGKYYQCNVSGNASALQSAAAAITTTCRGGTLASYKSDSGGKRVNWPQGSSNPICPVGGVKYKPTASFASVFDVVAPATAIGTLVDSTNSDYAHWVVAMLNATQLSSTFPYSTLEVRALYQDSQRRQAAIEFFKNYLEG